MIAQLFIDAQICIIDYRLSLIDKNDQNAQV